MTKPRSVFIRAHAYSAPKVEGVLDEASRSHEEVSKHVPHPKPPQWLVGDRLGVQAAIDEYMEKGAAVQLKDGTTAYRRRRSDARCLVAGVASWPDPIEGVRGPEKVAEVRAWAKDTVDWLQREYGNAFRGAVMHIDESHPHLHFFVVGDAQRLHPGLRAELVDDKRIEEPKERMQAHKGGLSEWITRYATDVCERFGLVRPEGSSRPAWRITDRSVRAELHSMDKRLAELEAQGIDVTAEREKRDAFWDQQPKAGRHKLRF